MSANKMFYKILTVIVFMAMVLSACAPAATATPAAATSAPATVPPAPTNTAAPATATTAPAAAATATTAATPATAVPVTPTVASTKPTSTAVTRTENELILSTTTSTRDTGLLDVLLPMFEKQCGCTVKMIAVGSGAALQMGQDGNADVLLVHAPASEKIFMDKGFGQERLLVMHNDFVILGPAADPANIKGIKSPADAFKKIADAKATFVSRGDNSGTNQAELAIWKLAGITPTKNDAWYLQTGGAMGDTLNVANQKAAYTISDRGTYLAYKANLQLDILVQGDPSLLNIYHVITVNPEKWPKVNIKLAKEFASFMVSADTQKVIAAFGIDKYGQPLFFPDAGKKDSDVGK
jgi:tungstate transport system substrate-binding protein